MTSVKVRIAVAVPEEMRGDGPCSDCGTLDNIVWFTESVFWNAVCRSEPDYVEPILCIPCFVIRAETMGYRPTGWRLLPEWPWRTADLPIPEPGEVEGSVML